jgi:23S rRNA (pseudouridine1915-N3)-methyltransferase
MFRINIICPGKNKDRWVNESVSHYLKLLKKYALVEMIYVPALRNTKNLSDTQSAKKETGLIKKHLESNYKIALSDEGRQYSSREFAAYLSRLFRDSGGKADFIIGGAGGLEKKFIESCNDVISLSPMTLSHQLIRPVLLEQLYRGFSILTGGKYHK